MPAVRRWLVVWMIMGLGGCEVSHPEVAVVNHTAASMLVRNIRFNGCTWPTTLAMDDVTSPGRCLPGEDRIHFERFNGESYAQRWTGDAGTDAGLAQEEPLWFAYQTQTVHRVEYGQRYLLHITVEDMEQDFSVPGPYGH